MRGQGPWSRGLRRLRRHRASKIAGALLTLVVLLSVLAPWIAPYDYATQDLTRQYEPPSLQHPFGTDANGRDLFTSDCTSDQ